MERLWLSWRAHTFQALASPGRTEKRPCLKSWNVTHSHCRWQCSRSVIFNQCATSAGVLREFGRISFISGVIGHYIYIYQEGKYFREALAAHCPYDKRNEGKRKEGILVLLETINLLLHKRLPLVPFSEIMKCKSLFRNSSGFALCFFASSSSSPSENGSKYQAKEVNLCPEHFNTFCELDRPLVSCQILLVNGSCSQTIMIYILCIQTVCSAIIYFQEVIACWLNHRI